MRRFDQETAIAAIELEQMVADYWREVDMNGAVHAADYFTEDGVAIMGLQSFAGRAEIARFYAERLASNHAQFGAGNRRTSHTIVNLRIVFDDKDQAGVEFMTVTYAAVGKLPVSNATLPAAIGEVRLSCRRDGSGQWLIHAFHGAPVFLSGDDYVQKAFAPR